MGIYSVFVQLKDAYCITECVATSVYGRSSANDKVDFWAELTQVVGLSKCPLVLGRDFNVIRFLS